MDTFPYQNIVVIGVTGAGKSTLANNLANLLELRFIELDALNWGPNWTASTADNLCKRVDEATRNTGWVVAGNYSETRPITWARSQAIVWLDYSLWIAFWRLCKRTIRRSILREELWNGNREIFWWHLKLWSDESLFHWLFQTYWRRKHEYPRLFVEPNYSHLKVFHHKSPKETQLWLENICHQKDIF